MDPLDNKKHGVVHTCFIDMLNSLEKYLEPSADGGKSARMKAFSALREMQQAFAQLPPIVAIQYLASRPNLAREYKWWRPREEEEDTDTTTAW